MQPEQQATLLRLFVGERDRHGHQPLYEAIVNKAREQGLAGATVLRGLLGYGASSVLHTAKLVEISDDLPMVVEIVDAEEKIEKFLPLLDDLMASGLVTLEKVRVLQYGMPKKR
jgi:PII-like signaling protein